jgi:hypothetical protein
LPAWGARVKALFVAVPQIEHNWTANDRPPQKLNEASARLNGVRRTM